MKQNVGLKLRQTQQLNLGLQQSLRILQMSSQELEHEVEDWLQDNPLLEKNDTETEAALQLEQFTAAVGSRNIGGDDAEDIWATIAHEDNFNEYLHKQVCEHPLTPVEADRVHLLIDFLDEQGYLSESLDEIGEHIPLEWSLDPDALQDALDLLQNFEPAGVGAADLAESLLLQLMRLPASPERQVAGQIVRTILHELGPSKQQNKAKCRKYFPEADAGLIEAALAMIADLNPYPAYGFASAEPTAYIQPDVFIKDTKDGWKVVGNQQAWPQIALNQDYCEMLKESEEVSDVWKEKLAEARQRIDSLEMRKNTVVRLAEYVLSKQEDFFTFGEVGLVPLLMKDAAVELGIAESTVSRAVNQKYLACPRGVFALRYFFTQAVAASRGEDTSQSAVKAMLSELVKNENKEKPFSDEALVKLLQKQGVSIARRTVAKYREALGIPPAHQRKP
ncbi:RNA polymerase factor sigma-54 [Neisseria weaveri]|uniref:RNA polymerase factor sigma-54 n=1 Tax=Neisseria weaveri TaxID=28091 RepID=UPI000D325030|nr:RNA polymerase factor sigma-54 [Neisseria weaveri]